MQKSLSLDRQLHRQFFKGNYGLLILAVSAALINGLLNLYSSWLLMQLIDLASGAQHSYSLALLSLHVLGLLAGVLFSAYLSWLSRPRFLARAMQQYKDYAFAKLCDKSIDAFQAESSASYLSALSNDAASIETQYITQQFRMFSLFISLVAALLMMLYYSPLLTLIAIMVALLPLSVSLLFGLPLKQAEHKVSLQNESYMALLNDCLGGFSVMKGFQVEKEIFAQFAKSNAALEGEKFKRERLRVLVNSLGAVTAIIAQFGVFLVSTYLYLQGYGLSPGVVLVFANLMNAVIQPLSEFPSLLAGRKSALALVEKLSQSLSRERNNPGTKTIAALTQGIEIQDLHFAYEPGKPILKGIHARFSAGKAYAIVGGSGSGKSTLLQLLSASKSPYEGSIRLDGQELSQISTASLYEQLSLIQQHVFLFNASIEENISMFRTFPKEALDKAIEQASLSELIQKRGVDFVCGELGKNLSGGEKQRISIARGLLKKASLLLADEITSALDAQTAHQVTNDLLALKGITRILVTHALDAGLLAQFDGILVLKDGRVEESGTFAELMDKKGYFYALYTVAQ